MIYCLSLSGSQGDAVILVQDMNGRKILNEVIVVEDQRVNHEVVLDRISSGLYIITVQSEDELFTEKIIVK